MSEGHFARVGDRATGLGLEVGRATVPELGEVQAGVQHGRGVDRAFLPVVADRGLDVVGAAHRQVVAGVARNEAGLGQARIEIELLAQFDQCRVADLGRLDGLDRFLVGSLGGNMQGDPGKNDQGAELKAVFHRFFSLV
ncbi:hypothetical protein SDC9_163012 [bioreactor metagenome]|uniref:Uncharacterized protein n=1 Tax=bioreactor metagenome TaxID=1076179 RepID=A0A645FMN4_9ZZZZ